MTTRPQRDGGIALVVRSLVALCVAGAVLASLRAVVESRRYFEWGAEAQSVGDWESAVLHHRHAVQWYAPVGTRAGAALDELVAIGAAREAAGDVEGALVAYRSARHAVMAIRNVGTPYADRLPAIHERIGALMALQTGDPEDAARFAAQLDDYESRRPSPKLALGASLAFFAWLIALSMLAWRGFTPSGGVAGRAFAKWSGVSLVALALWLTCLRLA